MLKNIVSFIPSIGVSLGLSVLMAADMAMALSPPFAPVAAGTVFADSSALDLEIDAPLHDIFKLRSDDGSIEAKKFKVAGKLRYSGANGSRIEIAAQFNMKGFSSIHLCNFPKLELKLDPAGAAGTIFEGTKSIDLNTHCDYKKTDWISKEANYTHREEIIYQIAKALEVPTFNSRPVFVRYLNTGIPDFDSSKTYPAFLLEDTGALKKRLGATELKSVSDGFKDGEVAKDPSKEAEYIFRSITETDQADPEDAARIALFEALIVNHDWFVSVKPEHFRFPNGQDRLWNIKVLKLKTGEVVPFPQDFNFATILSGQSYFDLRKDIYDVVDRASQKKIEDIFVAKKAAVYAAIDKMTGDPEGKASFRKSVDSFYLELIRRQ
ncbi:MAG: hypothetical protein V4692_12630 [Bdellovibrionota bacterium]